MLSIFHVKMSLVGEGSTADLGEQLLHILWVYSIEPPQVASERASYIVSTLQMLQMRPLPNKLLLGVHIIPTFARSHSDST